MVRFFFKKKIEKNNFNLNPNLFSGINQINEQLLELCYQSGYMSRFFLDSRIDNNKFKEMYSIWLLNSINTGNSDLIVFKYNEKYLGFVTYKIKNSNVSIELIAVDESSRGMGVGRCLLEAVEDIAVKFRLNKVLIPTQLDNNNAIAFYKHLGYEVFKREYLNHIWYDENSI